MIFQNFIYCTSSQWGALNFTWRGHHFWYRLHWPWDCHNLRCLNQWVSFSWKRCCNNDWSWQLNKLSWPNWWDSFSWKWRCNNYWGRKLNKFSWPNRWDNFYWSWSWHRNDHWNWLNFNWNWRWNNLACSLLSFFIDLFRFLLTS